MGRPGATPTIWQKCAGPCEMQYADWCICQTHGLCPMCHAEADAPTAPNESATTPVSSTNPQVAAPPGDKK